MKQSEPYIYSVIKAIIVHRQDIANSCFLAETVQRQHCSRGKPDKYVQQINGQYSDLVTTLPQTVSGRISNGSLLLTTGVGNPNVKMSHFVLSTKINLPWEPFIEVMFYHLGCKHVSVCANVLV